MGASVLLGITGGIAAYKAPLLVRLMVKAGMNVHVVMTRAATEFVTPMTLATLSGNSVSLDMWGERDHPAVKHISLADATRIAVVAPATANFIGKLANGIADDMLTTTLMAYNKPTIICPSMNVNMYQNPILQANLQKLNLFGYQMMIPDSGELACGWTGEGRMPEPEAIFREVERRLGPRDLDGLRVLVTAGPTEEPLDPVRFLTNRSSGRMGVAIAKRALARGADVTLISGPLKVATPHGVNHIPVRTALEMMEKVLERFHESDLVVKAAAVADFRPEIVHEEKIKKEELGATINLVRNPDILATLGSRKWPDQILVGFAAETSNAIQNARIKLKNKNVDILVLNDVSKTGAGFDCETNIVRLMFRSGDEEQLSLMSKEDVADKILSRALDLRRRVNH
ncbi:MAG: bifunctional phosphopantothenoylcysteine decarboxylase/phosphopantothenate--cysteine ligase CoaBC [Deltaproteobacteria bacterium]|nr:bifunctional phosphopantothenoylcysteine decarboxylase/phosphopantothenate--cysteine ligase CoaBC [Deltaproteobacteria bacterium]